MHSPIASSTTSLSLLLLLFILNIHIPTVLSDQSAFSITRHFDQWSNSDASPLELSNPLLLNVRRHKRQTDPFSSCTARCSLHFMLPCTFPALDPCLRESCDAKCKREGKVTNSCYCRTIVDHIPNLESTQAPTRKQQSVTYRACFCQPSQEQIEAAKVAVSAGLMQVKA